jgi:general secretion pathway protein H
MSSAGSRLAPAAGFTLLEFLVVLAILGLVLAIVPANLIRGTGAQALKADARQLAGALHYARTWAISRNDRIALIVDSQTGQITVDSRPIGHLSATTEIVARGDGLENWQVGGPVTVEFLPDGGSSGGDILLSYQRLQYRLNVNWLTGAVAMYQE